MAGLYAALARAGATVSLPIAWEQLGLKRQPGSFTVLSVPRRLERQSTDPFKAIQHLAH